MKPCERRQLLYVRAPDEHGLLIIFSASGFPVIIKFQPATCKIYLPVQMPPPPGELRDYCFNFSVASIMFLKLFMQTWFIRQHILTYYKYKSVLNPFKYGTQLWFSTNRHKYAIFSFEFIKVWCLRRLRHDLSRNTTSRLAIKFPSPTSGDQIPSLPGKKRRQMPLVYQEGGMLKLRFEWYISCEGKFFYSLFRHARCARVVCLHVLKIHLRILSNFVV